MLGRKSQKFADLELKWPILQLLWCKCCSVSATCQKKEMNIIEKNYRWAWVILITLKTHILWQEWQCYNSFWDHQPDRPIQPPLKKFPRVSQFKERKRNKQTKKRNQFSDVNCGHPGAALREAQLPAWQQQQGGQELTVTSSDIPTCLIPSHGVGFSILKEPPTCSKPLRAGRHDRSDKTTQDMTLSEIPRTVKKNEKAKLS